MEIYLIKDGIIEFHIPFLWQTISIIQNQLIAIKMQIWKSLKSYKYNHNNRTGYQRYVIIDMPFSQQAFNAFFRKTIPKIAEISATKHFDLTVFDLEKVFGLDWYVSQSSKTTTQQRIIGMVSVNFRSKTSQG